VADLNTFLSQEQKSLIAERQRLQEQISTSEKELKNVTERLVHVEGLLTPIHASEDDSSEAPSPDYRDIRDIAVDVLKSQRGEPMHYASLAREIQARGGIIPGVDAANTLLSRLVRDERFVRPKRGHYALKSDHPDVESVGVRRRRVNGTSGKDQNP